jgi:hypothetical protein
LDYLLLRYRNSPEANRPAMFPLSKDTFINHRAIVVHHHLGQGSIPNISSRREAQNHVRAMIEHIWSPLTDEEAAALDDEPAQFAVPPAIDPVEAVREKLCDVDPAVRIQAALALGEFGGLDDIGFLSDLLSLPNSADEHPKEREAILHAMRRLSGESVEDFDLSFVPPLLEHSACIDTDSVRMNRPVLPRAMPNLFLVLLALSAFCFVIGVILFALHFLSTRW